MQPLKLTRILIVPPHDAAHAYELCQGIARYRAKGRPWLIQTMRLEGMNLIDRARDGEYSGAIMMHCSQELALQLHHLGLKVVLVGRPLGKVLDPRIGLIDIDNVQVGRMGAEHLLAQGFTRLAYFGFPVDWSENRQRGFRQTVVNAGRQCLEWVPPPGTDWNKVVYGDIVERWLTKAERPIAIMAFSDEGARRVLEFCLARQWAVPADIAVLGVEDHFFMRECLPIGLSSIQFNSERMGHQAAAMLDRMLRGSPPPKPILIPPTQVVVRQSTHVTEFADADVSRAVAFIRMHVTHGVSVEDLLELLQISRSTLERRFADVIGHSPAVEIRKTRLETARRMLIETNMPLIEVTVACGFSSISYFSHSFHHQYNMSPTRYRETFAGH